MDNNNQKYVIVTAVRDEIKTIQLTLLSVINQTVLPQCWVIIDDGSTDGTEKIVSSFAAKYPWIRLIQRSKDTDRAVGQKIVNIIHDGLAKTKDVDWDYWVKLDADIGFDAYYFSALIQNFQTNPQLGMASGKGYVPAQKGGYTLEWCPDHHVLGMVRMYRRACWQDIGGLAPRRMWDVIDVYAAQMHGWQTRSFSELKVRHMRPIDGMQTKRFSRKFDSGLNHYTMGYYFPYFSIRCLRSAIDEKPYLISGLMMFVGFLYGWLARKDIYDPQLRDFIQQKQREALTPQNFSSYLNRRGHAITENIDKTNSSTDTNELNVLGVRFHKLTITELIAKTMTYASQPDRVVIANVNVHALNISYELAWYRDFLNSAELVFCDGFGVALGARLLNEHILAEHRMTCPDWIEDLASACVQNNRSLFLLAGEPGIAEKAAEKLRDAAPGLKIAVHHGFFEKTGSENEAVIAQINAFKPDIIYVGMGMPLQEKWIQQNIADIDARVFLPLGACLDFYTGSVYRFPLWVTDNGLEWLGRLLVEPRRLWRRYLVGNPKFLWRVLQQRLGRLDFYAGQ